MAARPELRVPATAADMHAAAKHFVNIAHGERDVIQATFAIWQRQQEQVMMSAMRRAAQERATSRVTIRHLEAEQFLIKLLRFGKVVGEEHHVSHFHRFGSFIDRRRLIHA